MISASLSRPETSAHAEPHLPNEARRKRARARLGRPLPLGKNGLDVESQQDELVGPAKFKQIVIPAQAGILGVLFGCCDHAQHDGANHPRHSARQSRNPVSAGGGPMDSRLRGNDDVAVPTSDPNADKSLQHLHERLPLEHTPRIATLHAVVLKPALSACSVRRV